MLRCDLHVHTSFSKDGESSVEECLRAAEDRGLDAIAICDHDTMDGVRYAQSLESPVMVIPGIEVSTHEGHMIALGVHEPIPDGLPFEESVERARRMGGLVILPHPYHKWRHGVALKIRDALEMVDAVESFNSRYITGSANRKADRMARELGKPRVAGSDAHNARFIGYGETLVDAEKNIDAVLAAIREGRCQIRGRMTPLRTYTRQSMRGAKRRIARKMQHR